MLVDELAQLTMEIVDFACQSQPSQRFSYLFPVSALVSTSKLLAIWNYFAWGSRISFLVFYFDISSPFVGLNLQEIHELEFFAHMLGLI